MRCIRWLTVVLMSPSVAFAAPLQAVLVGDYRPLKAAEAASHGEGFEASWLAELGEVMGSKIVVVGAREQANVQVGTVGSGAIYYSSDIAALTAAEKGPAAWSDLDGKVFCVAEGSPYAPVVESRFGGTARSYPSAAQSLIGLKLGECQAVVDDRLLLQQIATLPEWRRYNRLLPSFEDASVSLRIEAHDSVLQQRLSHAASSEQGKEALVNVTQHWIDEVAFQAYVLAETLDCH